jgi:hypothetical protein
MKDTTTVKLMDSSTVIKNCNEHIILIQDLKKEPVKNLYEKPIVTILILPILVAIITAWLTSLLNKKKYNLEKAKIEQDIKGAEQTLKDEQVKLELANKNFLLEIQKAENDYKGKYDNLLEERKKYNLDLLKYKEQQISELKVILLKVNLLLSDIRNGFDITNGWEIIQDDYDSYLADYIINNHKEINQKLSSISSETFLFYSVLNPLFEEVISSITILMNRINRDRERGIDTTDQGYNSLHSEQAKSTIGLIKSIAEKIREIIEPIKA